MGIARGAVALLLEEAKRRPYNGHLLTLGRQTIYTTADEVARQFAKFNLPVQGSTDLGGTEITDDLLFRWMGFDYVESMDYSDFEGATHVADLNKDSLPSHLVNNYEVVIDSGTIEHVFHLPNALRNAASLVKVGGRLIFLSPSSNHLDHGFYMFSPTLFYDYFIANRFSIETIYLIRYSTNLNELWDAYLYEPGAWRDLHIGGLDDRPYAIFVVVTRQAESTFDIIPQQGFYADNTANYSNSRLASGRAATSSISATPTSSLNPSLPKNLQKRLKDFVKRLLYPKVVERFKSHVIFSKKLVGRY